MALLLLAPLTLALSLVVSVGVGKMLALRDQQEHDPAEAMRQFGAALDKLREHDAARSSD